MEGLPRYATNDRLLAQKRKLEHVELKTMFDEDPNRFMRFVSSACGILLDCSKQRIDAMTYALLFVLAEEAGVPDAIQALLAGRAPNSSEGRYAAHPALRSQSPPSEVKATLDKMRLFVAGLHRQELKGATGRVFEDVLCLGIGGSDLGPVMAIRALHAFKQGTLNIHFLSNVDASTATTILDKLNAETTLVLINSKTFSTTETLTNAAYVRDWLSQSLPNGPALQHLYAVTAEPQKARAWGIDEAQIFEFWPWVGGRYSIWSAVGLPLALAIGWDNFQSFLRGAADMDAHFGSAKFTANLAVKLALMGVWNTNYLNATSHAVIPYADGLQDLVAYLQQLEMESNGKSCDQTGQTLDCMSTPILWGGVGCNSQHAFMQLIHQGPCMVPVDFILPIQKEEPKALRELMYASCLSQSRALMLGQQGEGSATKYCPGNRPSNTLVLDDLSPATLGSLLALYEHKVFVQSVLWQCNAFDQWGVELGKQQAQQVLQSMQVPDASLDCSTLGLLAALSKQIS